MNFSFTQNKSAHVTVFFLQGRLMEKHHATALINEIENALANGCNKFILNLEKLEYLNSTGLGVLISLYTKIRNHSGELILSNISEPVKKLILISKLNSVFTIIENTDDAKKYFQTKPIS
ncbi:MAG: STAS domain-containing protein [Bacteroidetes bacterium]|nr:anti-sigma factor antagonist [Bacteroidota bacterium]MBV6461893.1 Anti-sigma F factor antagonist [Flavobacteriales bacterium]WKZ74463.1 MAG: STAS domain-containing protein [Vicingaceae bacterium]MCL4816190.1 STAS domain-containing protein [Flavobacteriales bacterium]NOG95076.1 STAS domain-containing protein [Bacteroidota bacterium]